MIIKPKIRGFICTNAHPVGCAQNVQEQIDTVTPNSTIAKSPSKVLVIGASTGYGLASRVVSTWACGADTIGIYFERPPTKTKPGSAGWYNTLALEQKAKDSGYYAKGIQGDAFSDAIKEQTVELIKKDWGKVDLVVYSLAAPRRIHPKTGEVFKSVLKPISQPFYSKTINTSLQSIESISIESASAEEIEGTRQVMGGEDWQLWLDALEQAGVLAEGASTIAYSYIGPELTWPIYRNGTIGKAKAHLETTARQLDTQLKAKGGWALVAVNKAVVTQASSAIPVIPLYISLLFKEMKAAGTHEGCIEQIDRLFRNHLYSKNSPELDSDGLVHMDNWEMNSSIQAAVQEAWPKVTTENLAQLTDFAGYQEEFLKLFGFGRADVDYEADVPLD